MAYDIMEMFAMQIINKDLPTLGNSRRQWLLYFIYSDILHMRPKRKAQPIFQKLTNQKFHVFSLGQATSYPAKSPESLSGPLKIFDPYNPLAYRPPAVISVSVIGAKT